jgi:hypothetical protein
MFIHPSIRLEIVRQRQRELLARGERHERMSAQARELAQRQSGSDEVLLLWYPESERVELSVRDVATGVGVHVDVAPGNAIDAFYHPFAYLAGHERSPRVARPVATSVDE